MPGLPRFDQSRGVTPERSPQQRIEQGTAPVLRSQLTPLSHGVKQTEERAMQRDTQFDFEAPSGAPARATASPSGARTGAYTRAGAGARDRTVPPPAPTPTAGLDESNDPLSESETKTATGKTSAPGAEKVRDAGSPTGTRGTPPPRRWSRAAARPAHDAFQRKPAAAGMQPRGATGGGSFRRGDAATDAFQRKPASSGMQTRGAVGGGSFRRGDAALSRDQSTGKTAEIEAAVRREGNVRDPKAVAAATRAKMIGRPALQRKAAAARSGDAADNVKGGSFKRGDSKDCDVGPAAPVHQPKQKAPAGGGKLAPATSRDRGSRAAGGSGRNFSI